MKQIKWISQDRHLGRYSHALQLTLIYSTRDLKTPTETPGFCVFSASLSSDNNEQRHVLCLFLYNL